MALVIQRKIPTGTRDKLFREASGAYRLEHKVNAVVKERGYQRVETPTIEFADLFDEEESELYRFFDNKGNLLALRSDMTTPIGRVVENTKLTLPVKLSYSGKIYRANEAMRGEQNEISQAGIELIGFSSVKAEVEALLCAYDILQTLQISDFHFEIGHAQIFHELVSVLSLTEGSIEEFRQMLESKNISGLKAFTEKYPSELDTFIQQLPFLFGFPEKVFTKARGLLPEGSFLRTAIDEMSLLLERVENSLADVVLTVDLGLVPTQGYYTGLLFNGFADKIADVFLRGGRYDELVQTDEQAVVPAVGMGINLDTLVDLQYRLNTLEVLKTPSIFIHYEDWQDLVIAEELQRQTLDSQLSLFETFEEAEEFAKLWQFSELWLLKNGEVTKLKVGE